MAQENQITIHINDSEKDEKDHNQHEHNEHNDHNDHNEHEKDEKDELNEIENMINNTIGFAWWKRYVAAAFWSNLATPINLCVSIITLFTTGETSTKALLPQGVYVNLSVAALFISFINSFFAPHTQMVDNIKLMNEWREFANKFESIHFSPNLNSDDYSRRLNDYRSLLDSINSYSKDVPERQNFLTDLIHIIVRKFIFKNNDQWLVLKKQKSN